MSTSIQKKIGFCRLLANTILRLGRPREFVTTPEARQCLTCGNREASFLKGGADHAQLRGNTWSGPRDPGSNSPAGLPVLARRFFFAPFGKSSPFCGCGSLWALLPAADAETKLSPLQPVARAPMGKPWLGRRHKFRAKLLALTRLQPCSFQLPRTLL